MFKELIDVKLDSGVQDLSPAYNLAKFSQLLTRFEAMFNVNVFIAEKKNFHWVLKQLFGNYLNLRFDNNEGTLVMIQTMRSAIQGLRLAAIFPRIPC